MRQGEEVSITILLHFVSHTSDLKEIKVNLDPNSGSGLTIEKGVPNSNDTYNINQLIRYEPNGTIRIKAGETIPVKLIIKVSEELPS